MRGKFSDKRSPEANKTVPKSLKLYSGILHKRPVTRTNTSVSKNRAKTVTKYTEPEIRRIDSGWYVEFKYFHGGQWERFRIKDGVNRIKDLRKKEAFAKKLKSDLKKMLSSGFNPCVQKREFTLAEAIDIVYSQIKGSKKTQQHYATVFESFFVHCESAGYILPDIGSGEVSEFLRTKDNLAQATKNRYIQGVKYLFDRMVDEGIVSHNPVRQKIKKPKPKGNIPLSLEEKNQVKDYLLKVHPRFLKFIEVFFYTGLRPFEVLSLTKDNLYDSRIILFHTDSKVGRQRVAPLNDYVKSILVGEGYFFGRDFAPEVRQSALHSNRAGELWKKYIKNELGINKTLYSIRHLSAIEHWKNNKDLYALRDFLGHSTISMTENYMRSLVGFNLELNTNSGIEF